MTNEFSVRGDVTAILIRRKDGNTLESLIDTSDLWLAQSVSRGWHAIWREDSKTFYVAAWNDRVLCEHGKSVRVMLHRLIMGTPELFMVDHRNHDGLDNRRMNLRNVTNSRNSLNRRGPVTGTASGVRGVIWDRQRQAWMVLFQVSGVRHFLGRFKDKERASLVARAFLDSQSFAEKSS